MSLIMVLAGGCLGAISRYEISRQIETFWRNHFPLGTFLINIVGSFLIGLVFQADWGVGWHSFLAVGFLGSFTTFSTFFLEIVQLGSRRKIAMAIGYLLSSYMIGILSAFLAISI